MLMVLDLSRFSPEIYVQQFIDQYKPRRTSEKFRHFVPIVQVTWIFTCAQIKHHFSTVAVCSGSLIPEIFPSLHFFFYTPSSEG